MCRARGSDDVASQRDSAPKQDSERSRKFERWLLMREMVHSYPPLIVLQPGLLASPSSSSSQAEAMRALLGDTTPYRLAAEARDKGASKSLRVAGVHSKLQMKCSGSAAGCVPIL